MSQTASTQPRRDARRYFIVALSPLHAGVGEGVGGVNLPTARERATGFPFLPGSSVKGVLREAAERAQGRAPVDRHVWTVFGPPTDEAAEARGGLVFSDASLMCLPVRSLFGTFAWATCPLVLSRLARDAAETGAPVPARPPRELGKVKALVPPGSQLLTPGFAEEKKKGTATAGLFLEELLVPAVDLESESAIANKWADWIAEAVWPRDAEAGAFFRARFLVVSDQLFDFMSRTATEVRSRVKINDKTGTAADSGPWTEEYLPAETLLYGLLIARPTQYVWTEKDESGNVKKLRENRGPADVLASLDVVLRPGAELRFGGKSSVGMGRARIEVPQ